MEEPDPTALQRATSYGGATIAAAACEWKRRPAALAMLNNGIALANTNRLNGRLFAPWANVTFEANPNQPGTWAVTFYSTRETVRSPDPGDLQRFVAAVHAHRSQLEQGRTAAADPFKLAPGDRGLKNNIYLGGANTGLQQRDNVSLVFREDRIEVWPGNRASGPTHQHLLANGTQLDISGPGKVTTGGRFIGGGSGLIGAAEGIAIASLLNAMTSRTTITTILTITDYHSEAFFLQAGVEPHDLRMHLSPFFVAQRRYAVIPPLGPPGQPALAANTSTDAGDNHVVNVVDVEVVEDMTVRRAGPDPVPTGAAMVENLRALAEMRRAGDLTDEEYAAAKRALLGQ